MPIYFIFFFKHIGHVASSLFLSFSGEKAEIATYWVWCLIVTASFFLIVYIVTKRLVTRFFNMFVNAHKRIYQQYGTHTPTLNASKNDDKDKISKNNNTIKNVSTNNV